MTPEIKPYRGYMVTNAGIVYSKESKGTRPLKQAISTTGYPQVYLCFNGKTKAVKVHRLVAELFIPNPEQKREINHKDGNKTNCCANNLEWCTHHENMRHAYDTGLSSTKRVTAYDADGRLFRTFDSVKEAAAFFKEGPSGRGSHIVQAARGKRKTAHGFSWRYT